MGASICTARVDAARVAFGIEAGQPGSMGLNFLPRRDVAIGEGKGELGKHRTWHVHVDLESERSEELEVVFGQIAI